MDKRLKAVYDVLEKVNAEDIAVYDFDQASPFYQYFVVATLSDRQATSAVGYLQKEFKKDIKRIEGKDAKGWVLIDLGDIIIHLFSEEDREFYGFDRRFLGLRKKI